MFCHFYLPGNVIKNLQSHLKTVLKWFGSNQMMENSGKLQYTLLGKRNTLKIEIELFQLESAEFRNNHWS